MSMSMSMSQHWCKCTCDEWSPYLVVGGDSEVVVWLVDLDTSMCVLHPLFECHPIGPGGCRPLGTFQAKAGALSHTSPRQILHTITRPNKHHSHSLTHTTATITCTHTFSTHMHANKRTHTYTNTHCQASHASPCHHGGSSCGRTFGGCPLRSRR